ncbi:hypothetical protein [Pleomorphomonas carboxyditropha]|uniref:hypothetical protein n=1 Tax=Pleomorphomonas carboxyditropha TaxID=2023338 RepID=UPI001055E612|nr:hypothetical protein [Pleomorphomonas carboxyditropha]
MTLNNDQSDCIVVDQRKRGSGEPPLVLDVMKWAADEFAEDMGWTDEAGQPWTSNPISIDFKRGRSWRSTTIIQTASSSINAGAAG